jgi:hypothetical protein
MPTPKQVDERGFAIESDYGAAAAIKAAAGLA